MGVLGGRAFQGDLGLVGFLWPDLGLFTLLGKPWLPGVSRGWVMSL